MALLIYTIVNNHGISPTSENWADGPSAMTLIRNRGNFVPCMKSTEDDTLNGNVTCQPNSSLQNDTCTYEEFLWYVCNVDNLKSFSYQVYRFFIPIFL